MAELFGCKQITLTMDLWGAGLHGGGQGSDGLGAPIPPMLGNPECVTDDLSVREYASIMQAGFPKFWNPHPLGSTSLSDQGRQGRQYGLGD